MRSADRSRTSIAVAGGAAWLLVSVPTWLEAYDSPRFSLWAAAWLACGVALVVTSLRGRLDRVMATGLVIQGAAVATMVGLLCNGFEGMLLVFAAAQLGRVATSRIGLAWVIVQTAVVAITLGHHWSPKSSLMLMPPYLGFQLFALFAMRFHATRVEHSRLEERLAIARELHDVLGHHLTAMSLNLEVAAHQTSGAARDNVRVAQSIARLLLGDVRELAYAMKLGRPVELVEGLHRLAEIVPSPVIHVDAPGELVVADPRCAHALLRCAQEFVTNSIRHANARNVWLALTTTDAAVELAATDDGTGVRELRPGGGLSGMRERVEELGGTLTVDSGGAGFAVRATVPA